MFLNEFVDFAVRTLSGSSFQSLPTRKRKELFRMSVRAFSRMRTHGRFSSLPSSTIVFDLVLGCAASFGAISNHADRSTLFMPFKVLKASIRSPRFRRS